jgi:hypothetical protein
MSMKPADASMLWYVDRIAQSGGPTMFAIRRAERDRPGDG